MRLRLLSFPFLFSAHFRGRLASRSFSHSVCLAMRTDVHHFVSHQRSNQSGTRLMANVQSLVCKRSVGQPPRATCAEGTVTEGTFCGGFRVKGFSRKQKQWMLREEIHCCRKVCSILPSRERATLENVALLAIGRGRGPGIANATQR